MGEGYGEPDWEPQVKVDGEVWFTKSMPEVTIWECEHGEEMSCPNKAAIEAQTQEGACKLLCESCFQKWSGVDPETLGL